MKNSIFKYKSIPKLTSTILVISILLLFGCSSDDDNANDNAINVEDLIVLTLDENPSAGDSIGIINASSNSVITFSIAEQVFANAVLVNPNTGELTVGNASFFDFETNPSIQGVVEISNGAQTVSSDWRIDLNNKDDIAFSLTESKQEYIDAEAGEWIEITETEYDRLNQVLQGVLKSGFYMDEVTFTPSMNGVFTLANLDESRSSENLMPNNSLVFAFKYFAVETEINSDRHRVKQSSISNSTGFENIGNPLPPHAKSIGAACFVLKGSEDVITSDQGFLGFQKSSGSTMGIATTNGVLLFGLGETSDFNMESNGSSALYEGLSTTLRQWD